MSLELEPRLNDLTQRIIGAAFEVANALGHGFLESVYRKALLKQLSVVGLKASQEVPCRVLYCGEEVGHYIADLVVEGIVIIELKAVQALTSAHRAQLFNYLKASGLTVGLLFNFGSPRLQIKRVLL
jgi:GxxExxY protein